MDASDERIARIYMSREERFELLELMYETKLPIRSMSVSALTKYALGDPDKKIREKGMELSLIHISPIVYEERSVQLRIFVDHSSIEIFYDDRLTMSARIFPGREDSVENSVKVSDDVSVLVGRIYRLACETEI